MSRTAEPWPSTANVWVRCPAAIGMMARFSDSQDSPAAREGIAAHEVLEKMLAGNLPAIADATRSGVPVDAAMIDGAGVFLAALADVAIGSDGYSSELKVPGPELGAGINTRLDFVAIDHASRTVTVIDYKYGHRYVPVFDNWQLALGASAFAHEYQIPGDYEARLMIVQPRCYSASEKVRAWRISVATAHHLMSVAARSAEKARRPDAPFATGPHCNGCSGRRACSAFLTTVEAAVDDAYALSPRDPSPTDVAGELVLLREAGERIRARLTALEAHAMQLLQAGHSVPGWRVAYSKPHRVWTIPQPDVLALGVLAGVDLSAAKQVVTPAQAQELGLDAGIVDVCSSRPPGSPKLERLSPATVKTALSKG